MRKKRQNVQKVNIQNKANCYGGVMSDPDENYANAYKSMPLSHQSLNMFKSC